MGDQKAKTDQKVDEILLVCLVHLSAWMTSVESIREGWYSPVGNTECPVQGDVPKCGPGCSIACTSLPADHTLPHTGDPKHPKLAGGKLQPPRASCRQQDSLKTAGQGILG